MNIEIIDYPLVCHSFIVSHNNTNIRFMVDEQEVSAFFYVGDIAKALGYKTVNYSDTLVAQALRRGEIILYRCSKISRGSTSPLFIAANDVKKFLLNFGEMACDGGRKFSKKASLLDESLRLYRMFNGSISDKDTIPANEINTNRFKRLNANFASKQVQAEASETMIFTDTQGGTWAIVQPSNEKAFFLSRLDLFLLVGYSPTTSRSDTDRTLGLAIVEAKAHTRAFHINRNLTNRSSTNNVAYCIEIRSIPTIMELFIHETRRSTKKSRKYQKHLKAKKMLEWVNSTLIPKLYGNKPIQTQSQTFLPFKSATIDSHDIVDSFRAKRMQIYDNQPLFDSEATT